MKKLLGFLFAAAVAVLCMVSCHKVVRDKTTGLVDEITDSVMVVKIDGSKVVFDISEAQFTAGAVMYGDSVTVHYIGDLSMKRAFAERVLLIERPSQIITVDPAALAADTSKEVMTRPADAEHDKMLRDNSERFVRVAKKFAKQK